MAYHVLINEKWGQVGQLPSLGGPKTWPQGSLWAQLALHVLSLLVYLQRVVSSHSVITLSYCIAALLRPVITAGWLWGSVGPSRPRAEELEVFTIIFFRMYFVTLLGQLKNYSCSHMLLMQWQILSGFMQLVPVSNGNVLVSTVRLQTKVINI